MADTPSIDQILGKPTVNPASGAAADTSLQGQPVPKVEEHPIGGDVLSNAGNAASMPSAPATSTTPQPVPVTPAPQSQPKSLSDKSQTPSITPVSKPVGGDVLKNDNNPGGMQPVATTVVAGAKVAQSQPSVGGGQQPVVATPTPTPIPTPSPQPAVTPMGISPAPQQGVSSGPQPTPEERKKLEGDAQKMVKDLDKEGVGKKAKKPGGSGKKKMVGGVVAAVALLVLGGGMYIGMQYLSQPGSQEDRGKAGFIAGEGYCESTNGLIVISDPGGAGSPGELGYKPATADPNDPNGYYDVSAGEKVVFKVKLENTSSESVTEQFALLAHKIVESPKGTTVDENTPGLGEQQLMDNHDTGDPQIAGDTQIKQYSSSFRDMVIPAGDWNELYEEWTPTNDDCGLYQIDMVVTNFARVVDDQLCPVAAAFIRVSNCEEENLPPTCDSLTVKNNNDGTATITCVAGDPDGEINRVQFAYTSADPTNEEQMCMEENWELIADGVQGTAGTYTYDWNISGLSKDVSYTVAANLWDGVGGSCTGNPVGNCEGITEFTADCPECNASFIITDENQPPDCESMKVVDNGDETATITCVASDPDGEINRVQFVYTGQRPDSTGALCVESNWTEIMESVPGTNGVYTAEWDISNLLEGLEYTVAANLWDDSGDSCTGNPAGLVCNETVGTTFTAACPNCYTSFVLGDELVCNSLSYEPTGTPKLGDELILTCHGAGNVDHYDFERSISPTSDLNFKPIQSGDSKTLTVRVNSPGNWNFRCRVCDSEDDTSCTSWGAAQ